MATLKLLVPDGTTNYVKNPSFRYDTTGWTAVGSALTRVLTRARFGISSGQVVTNGTILNEGVYFQVTALTNISEPVTVSAYVRGTGRVRVRVVSEFGVDTASADVDLQDDRWTRLSVTGRHNGNGNIRVFVETNGSAAQARTFYVDGVQMERKAYPTTYADGEQPGCHWHGLAHNSNSIRDPYTRLGGRWVTVGGPAREEENLYMTVVGGMGVAPLALNTQPYGDSPGSYFQGQKVFARTLTFTFHAKHENLSQECSPVSLQKLHQLRQLLIDIVKPDRTAGGEEFLISYQDGAYPVYLRARYDGGLEGEWDIRNQWVNSFPLRLLAVFPYFTEDSQDVASLDFQNWEKNLGAVIGRIDGEWKNLNYGFNGGVVKDLAMGRRGEVIAVGTYTTSNGDAAAIDPLLSTNGVSYWDGDQWQEFAATGASGARQVEAVAVAPNGDIYVTGGFTTIGGVAANRIARWDGSAWNALGSGLTGTGLALAIAPNGDVYVGGSLSVAGGVSISHIARWDGGTWHNMGVAGGLNNQVFDLVITPDGQTLYACGMFTDQYGLAADAMLHVAKYDVASDTFEALGDGFNDDVRALRLAESGILYAGGDFTLSDTESVPHIGQWNGSAWSALGSGINGDVYAIDIAPDGDILACGDFTEAGGVVVVNTALWNGSTWVNLDLESTGIAANYIVYDGIYNRASGDIYLVGGETAIYGGVTTVENIGSAEVSPTIYIQGPATLRRIENWTTKKRIFFELDILDDEDVEIDFGRSRITSSVRGDLTYALLSGSDFRAFSLIPGSNKILAFMTDDVNATMQIRYTPRHWSADATQGVESL